MVCRTETVGPDDWRFCPDEPQQPGFRLRALVTAQVFDEISGLPMQVSGLATPDKRLARHVAARIAADGIVGLAGRPAMLFPQLALIPAPITMVVRAGGYLPLQLDGTLGPIAGFPANFAALDHGQRVMHRAGVSFAGRVVQRGTPGNTPLAGATVRIDGVWPSYPPPDVMPAAVMQPARMAALTPGLYRDHAAAVLARCTVVQNLAQAKQLLLPAVPGSTRLRLNNRQALAIGMPLLIDPPDRDRRETIGIRAIDTSFSADQPAWIDLDYPLAHLHRNRAQVIPTSVPATQDPRNLARPALTGDPIAFLNTAAPWLDQSLVQVDDGVNPLEYQWIEDYTAVADAAGYFRLPKLSRLALFRLRATHPTPLQPLLMTIEPDYGLAEQNLSVAFE